MKARVTLKPGQKGTKKLTAQYGDKLICVRYRYDVESRKKLKTVEIIVEESDWTPQASKYSAGMMVSLRIGPRDTSWQEQVRALGGRWDPGQRLWFIPYGCIAGTKLEKFIVLETWKTETK
jgi:hypothetical protein